MATAVAQINNRALASLSKKEKAAFLAALGKIIGALQSCGD